MMRAGSPRPTLPIAVLATLLGVAAGTALAFVTGEDAEPTGTPASAAPATAPTTTLADGFYTVVLASIPAGSEGSEADADRRAVELRQRGVEVDILDSSRYSTLNPGYLVVFSGRFGSEREADQHLDRLAARELPGGENPYVRQVKP